jgi:hypothetical protein
MDLVVSSILRPLYPSVSTGYEPGVRRGEERRFGCSSAGSKNLCHGQETKLGIQPVASQFIGRDTAVATATTTITITIVPLLLQPPPYQLVYKNVNQYFRNVVLYAFTNAKNAYTYCKAAK